MNASTPVLLALALASSTVFAPAAARGAEAAKAPARKSPRPAKPRPLATPERPLNIKADSGEVFPDQRRATWKGHVLVEYGDATLRCDELVAEYGTARQQIERLTARGNVHVVQQPAPPKEPREVWAEQAIFEANARTVVLSGEPRPRAKEGKSTIVAREFTFFLDENRLAGKDIEMQAETKAPALPPAAAPGAAP